MDYYIGTKRIKAEPMSLKNYNAFRNKDSKENNDEEEGYLVEYIGTGNPNVEGFANYVSWSPKNVFEEAYSPCQHMTFGLAIDLMKKGERVARSGWKEKGMYIFIDKHIVSSRLRKYEPTIVMFIGKETFQPGWSPSQADILYDDWISV